MYRVRLLSILLFALLLSLKGLYQMTSTAQSKLHGRTSTHLPSFSRLYFVSLCFSSSSSFVRASKNKAGGCVNCSDSSSYIGSTPTQYQSVGYHSGNCVAVALSCPQTQTHTGQGDGCHVMCCGSLYMFLYVTAEQLSCQQSREAAGPQIYSGPPHQYHLLQNEGTVPAFVCQSINIGCNELQPQFL